MRCVAFSLKSKGNYHFRNFRALETIYANLIIMDKILNYYQTKDYDKFKFFDYNRTIGSNTMLSRSLEIVDMTMYVPIIVTNDFYIIDGQNRFQMCRKLGLPITYTIYEGNPEVAMIALNTALKPWKQLDWFKYYVSKHNGVYLKLKGKIDARPIPNFSDAILLFSQNHTNAKQFREGKLKDESELYDDVYDFISTIEIPRDVRWYRAFVHGVMVFFQRHGGDRKKIEKLRRKISAVAKFSRVDDYVMAFENWVR